MSRDNLSSLLDAMLDDSATQVAADDVRETEKKRAAERDQRAKELLAKAKGGATPTIDAIEDMTGLPDSEFVAVLGAAVPDHILIVLATGSDALQRAILRNMSAESVAWLRENLAHIDHVHGAEREEAEKGLLKVANKLLRDGKIKLPEAESVGKEDAPLAEERDLRDLLTDLVRIAKQAGPAALAEVADSAGEPLLREGLRCVVDGQRGDALTASLTEMQTELEAAYRERLRWMRDAVVAIAEGESADSFRARMFK